MPVPHHPLEIRALIVKNFTRVSFAAYRKKMISLL